MIRVLVTGKGGQLSSCILDISDQYEDISFVFKSSSDLDITNTQKVNFVFEDLSPFDYCINCAAYTAVDKAETEADKAFAVNEEGAKNLAEACKKHSVTLIHISTDFVFDGKASRPYKEDDTTNPLGVYGASKLKGEEAVLKTINNCFIFRTSWLYSEFGSNFLTTMLRHGKERQELGVVGDQIGSPTYAKDLAKAIVEIIQLKSEDYGIYHYSNKGAVSWYDFAAEIFKQAKTEIVLKRIKTEDYPTDADRPKYSVLDLEKVSTLLTSSLNSWTDSLSIAISNLRR